MIKTHPKISVEHKPTKHNNVLDDQRKLSNRKLTNSNNNRVVWDCGSSLYDSFERSSFQKQLESAIINSSRSFSMPRLPSQDRSAPLFKELQQPLSSQPAKKQPVSPSKSISRSFQKLLKSVFRTHNRPKSSKASYDSSNSSPDPWFRDPVQAQEEKHKEFDAADGGRYYVVYDKRSSLSTIPEAPEVNYSPEIGSLVRKTMSDRFTAASLGIHCA